MTDELKIKIESSRRQCLKRFDEQTEEITRTIAKRNADARGMNLDEAIKALEEAD